MYIDGNIVTMTEYVIVVVDAGKEVPVMMRFTDAANVGKAGVVPAQHVIMHYW